MLIFCGLADASLGGGLGDFRFGCPQYLAFASLRLGHGLRPIKCVRIIFSYVQTQQKNSSATFGTAHCLRGHYTTHFRLSE